MFKNLSKLIVGKENTIINVIQKFNKFARLTEGKGFCLIINEKNQCVGVVTDGDIRRALQNGLPMDTKIDRIMNLNYVWVSENAKRYNIIKKFDNRVPIIPVLNRKKEIVDLYTYSSFQNQSISEKKIIRSSVPARVSFSGGGTDMSQYIDITNSAVLSTTINKKCISSLFVRSDEKINIISQDLNCHYGAESVEEIQFGDQLDLMKSAIKIMNPKFGFDLETVSDFDPGTGLGGSSAITVSIIGLLNYFRNENDFDKYTISDLAYQAERIDQSISGGWQDQYSTTFGGFNWIEFRKNEVIVNPLRINRSTLLELEFNLLFFKIGQSRNSSNIQKKIPANSKLLNNTELKNNLKKMTKLSIEMKESLLKGDVKSFGDLLDKSWNLKKIINTHVTNKRIDKNYNLARRIGALGGKLLGAGKSGYLMIYSSPKFKREIITALESNGLIYENIKFTDTGLEVWTTER